MWVLALITFKKTISFQNEVQSTIMIFSLPYKPNFDFGMQMVQIILIVSVMTIMDFHTEGCHLLKIFIAITRGNCIICYISKILNLFSLSDASLITLNFAITVLSIVNSLDSKTSSQLYYICNEIYKSRITSLMNVINEMPHGLILYA